MTPVLLLLTMVSTSAEAQRVKLDDSLSPTETYPVSLSWAPGEIKRSLNSLIAGTEDAGLPLTGGISNVEIRLDTRDFVGADARIYLTLPALVSGLDSPAGLEISWEASDQFLSGAVHPGQSTLVFDGTIEAPVTSAIFNFLLVLDTDTSADSFELEPIYELEVLP